MEMSVESKQDRRRWPVLAAWGSLIAAVVILFVDWQFETRYLGTRGERPPMVLFFYLALVFASAVGGLAGVISLFGVRSWRNALVILPAALLGIVLNGYGVFLSLLGYALLGRNLGG